MLVFLLLSVAIAFYEVQQDKIINKNDGTEFHIKGIAFTNNCYDTYHYEYPISDHDPSMSYADVASFGFNSVRFYMNSKVFESEPYVYRETGWAWLNKEIEFANKSGVKLILNMHLNQEGYGSNGKILKSVESQDQFFALWKEIATRYSNEETIIGFGLINEPGIPFETDIDTSMGVYQEFIKTTIKNIRSADKNHIIFLETGGIIGKSQTFGDYQNLFTIDDRNTVYEVHFYSPIDYTHQNASFNSLYANIPANSYSDDVWLTSGSRNWKASATSNNYYNTTQQGKWQKLSGSYTIPKSLDTNDYFAYLWVSKVQQGFVLFDNFKIIEKDEKGEIIKTKEFDFNEKVLINYWSPEGTGKCVYSKNAGIDNSPCYNVSGVGGSANIEIKEFFKPTNNHTYILEGYAYAEGINSDCLIQPRINFEKADYAHAFNKDYLKHGLSNTLNFKKDFNVPIYIGEFGLTNYCFKNNRNGDDYINDLLELCEENNLHFNYHSYHGIDFGLYDSNSYGNITNLNKPLSSVFSKKLPKMWVLETDSISKSDSSNLCCKTVIVFVVIIVTVFL